MSETDLKRDPTQWESTLEWYCKRAADNAIDSYRTALKKKIEERIVELEIDEGILTNSDTNYWRCHHKILECKSFLKLIDSTTI